jgi:predicted DNA-binding ribbon-helix-helix protein
MVGKRVQFDEATWDSVDQLARERKLTFQQLAEEAFRDLLEKHGRVADLKTALQRSAEESAPKRRR